jgi:polyisoprenoid-binding protein YceI
MSTIGAEMTSTTTAIETGTTRWAIDPAHSTVEFTVRHMMIARVRGRFPDLEATVIEAGDPSASSVEAVIQVASIDTRDEKRDAHLRSADFFDAENHPEIRFRSTGRKRTGADRFELAGELTIRGVTRPVTLDVTAEGRARDPWGGERVGYSARTRINRKDFGLEWNVALETGGFLVGDEIDIQIEAEAVLQS